MQSWMIVKFYPTTAEMTLAALVDKLQEWFPADATLITTTFSLSQPAYHGQPPYVLATLATEDMEDIDIALYELTSRCPIEYVALADREY